MNVCIFATHLLLHRFVNKILVYTLVEQGILGCFPECYVVETDEHGKLSSSSVHITRQNKSNFASLIDVTHEKLIQCCFQLQENTILTKILVRDVYSWDTLLKRYFKRTSLSLSAQDEYIKNYIVDYVNSYQNSFFQNIQDKPVYIPKGKFPFSWKQIRIENMMPEMFYCFENKYDSLVYSLRVEFENKKLSLTNAVLVSKNRARVIIKNTLYEFDTYVDGSKLIPFFKNEQVIIPLEKKQEYIQKVILPLIETNRVIPAGFEIIAIDEISELVLRVRESANNVQASLFEDNTPEVRAKDLIFELLYKYRDFQYWAGQKGVTSRLEMKDDTFTVFQVQRDYEFEKYYLEEISKLHIDLDAKIRRLPYYEGIEWLNVNHKALETLGVEIDFQRKDKENPVFHLGTRDISIQLEEGNDWFDIRGKVKFGEFEVPLLMVLNYLKNNKRAILLPNGEYGQIPQAWFDEYLTLAEFSRNEQGRAILPRQYIAIADELSKSKVVSLKVKENMLKLIKNDIKLDYKLPLHFQGVLRQYQQEGYNWLRLIDELGLGGCLADDMGLGKTIQTLCLLQWMKEKKRGTNLLVVPTSLVYNWQQEAAKFTPDLQVFVHIGSQRSRNFEEIGQPDILLTSYAILRRDKHLFDSQKFNYIILDEAQAIKNPHADISRVCLSLKADRFLTLTGTPIENSLSDLWSQVQFFSRNMLGTLSHFTQSCKMAEKQELYRQLIKPFLLRRHKKDVLKDLPQKNIIVHPCEMSEEQHKYYRELRNSYREKFLDGKGDKKGVNAVILLEGLLRLRQAANHPVLIDKEYTESSGKFEAVIEMLNDVLSQGDKVLVFSTFVEHLKLYRNYLNEHNILYCYLDGSTKDRQEQVERFQQQDDYQVFLLSLKAGGTGLNLTKANYVFLLDPWWNPAAESQAFDRAHRIGQNKSVFVYKFISQDTIEEKIHKLQEKKLQLSDTMLNNENEFLKQLDVEEVMHLIE